MSILLNLILSTVAWAAGPEWLNLPQATPVYVSPQMEAQILVMAREGERIAVRQQVHEFTRVQVKRNGKWKVGYVLTSDLETRQGLNPHGDFGWGLGGLYSYLRHGKKEFETDDQVKYTTDEFKSGTFSPFLALQYGQEGFWRLFLTYRLTNYSSMAATDVPGAQARTLTLEHTMISGILQKMWTPFGKPTFYLGLGFEASKAIAANLVLGGLKLPVMNQDLPTYLGGHGAFGGQFNIGQSVSAFAELRLGGYFNQSPIIMSAEGAVGLLYWP